MLLQDRRSQEENDTEQNGKGYTWTAKSAKKRETYGETMEMKKQWIGGERLIN